VATLDHSEVRAFSSSCSPTERNAAPRSPRGKEEQAKPAIEVDIGAETRSLVCAAIRAM
jgi:hypothetical protein